MFTQLSFVFIFAISFLSCIVPFPIFTSQSILTANEQQIRNDNHEIEANNISPYNSSQVLNLDWFENMNTIFTKYVEVKVIDIQSGLSYKIKRTGGYNHADVETIDAENTKIFKQVYNGAWSWTRRPVWVKIGTSYYAGSINGNPHGYSTIENNEGGHTCIHFLNSKTHGTKKVDEAHQNAVSYAYEHRNELSKHI